MRPRPASASPPEPRLPLGLVAPLCSASCRFFSRSSSALRFLLVEQPLALLVGRALRRLVGRRLLGRRRWAAASAARAALGLGRRRRLRPPSSPPPRAACARPPRPPCACAPPRAAASPRPPRRACAAPPPSAGASSPPPPPWRGAGRPSSAPPPLAVLGRLLLLELHLARHALARVALDRRLEQLLLAQPRSGELGRPRTSYRPRRLSIAASRRRSAAASAAR